MVVSLDEMWNDIYRVLIRMYGVVKIDEPSAGTKASSKPPALQDTSWGRPV